MPKEKKYDHICFGLKLTVDAAACDGGYLNSHPVAAIPAVTGIIIYIAF